MGKCIYCGNRAGLLQYSHPDCVREAKEQDRLHEEGKSAIEELAQDAAILDSIPPGFDDQVTSIMNGRSISAYERRDALIAGWERAAAACLANDKLDLETGDRLTSFAAAYSLATADLDANGIWTSVQQTMCMQDLDAGLVPRRAAMPEPLPWNLQKKEYLIWCFTGVGYYKQKIRRHRQGGTRGASFRLPLGLVASAPGTRGELVETVENEYIDTGMLGVTNKHTYFSGQNKTFRVRHDKIVAFTLWQDSVQLLRDTATAKPELFATDNPEFIYKLLLRAADL